MDASIDRSAPLALVGPGRFTKVAIQTAAGEIEAKLSEGGNWELRLRKEDEESWRVACRGDLDNGAVTAEPATREPLVRGPLVVDSESRTASVREATIKLSNKEFSLLAVLAAKPDRVFTKEELLSTIWDYDGTAKSVLTATIALVLAVTALAGAPGVAAGGSWYVLDAASGVFLALIAVVGLASAAVSPLYLRHAGRSWFTAQRSHAWYYAAFNLFWAALLALPLADNLALAWLLVEATTAASALLVAFSGKRSALEAGWKYVVLTTLGLAVALLGILVLYVAAASDGSGLGRLDWQALTQQGGRLPGQATLVAFVLVLVGLAGKIGWAPVHNWLPDAHSEAPPPVSAMLSAALLPTVLLIAWRTKLALEPALGPGTAQELFIGFGLASLLVAIPFLWRPLPWKRLLAYSSLEHMGVLALGIGFGTPLAIAGVVIHLAGHGLAKALGFYTAIPLLRQDPSVGERAPRGIARASAPTAAAMSVSLFSLSGLPPSPLFVSEVMILLGGMDAGLIAISSIAAVLLALGFLGLAHALLEGLLGAGQGSRLRPSRSARAVGVLAGAVALALIALTVAAYSLPGSDVVTALTGGGA